MEEGVIRVFVIAHMTRPFVYPRGSTSSRQRSPLAKQRLTRFDQDFGDSIGSHGGDDGGRCSCTVAARFVSLTLQDKNRPKGWCRIFAISDVRAPTTHTSSYLRCVLRALFLSFLSESQVRSTSTTAVRCWSGRKASMTRHDGGI